MNRCLFLFVSINTILAMVSGLQASVRDLDYPREGLRALEPTELSFQLDATFENPDDPGEIEVLATVTEPDGNTYDVPGFHYQDFSVNYHQRRIEKAGDPFWKVRWTPRQVGTHQLLIRVAVDGASSEEVARATVSVDPASEDAGGFIGIDPGNPSYFSYDRTGRTFWPMGYNLFYLNWPPFGFYKPGARGPKFGGVLKPTLFDSIHEHGEVTPEARFEVFDALMGRLRKTASSGATALRIRLDSWWQALEIYPGATIADPELADTVERIKALYPVGRYDPFSAWIADELLSFAEERQMGAILCMWNGQAAREKHWDVKPYWAPGKEDAELVNRKIRYFVARWGASPSVWTWEFFNEVGAKQNLPVDINGPFWTAAADYVRQLDPHDRPVNSGRENIDYFDHHVYRPDNHLSDKHMRYVRAESEKMRAPAIFGEIGIGVPSVRDAWKDESGNSFRHHLWRTMTGGGGGLLFWRVGRMDVFHLYDPTFRFAREIVEAMDFANHEWSFPPIDAGDSGMKYQAMRDETGRVLAYAERSPIDPGDRASMWTNKTPTVSAEAAIKGIAEGSYRVRWNDPASGRLFLEATVATESDRLNFPTPAGVERDAVLRIEPVR